jgi:hypothetical protein
MMMLTTASLISLLILTAAILLLVFTHLRADLIKPTILLGIHFFYGL